MGKGYDDGFVRNLKEFIEYLKAHPETKIKLVVEGDGICGKCPNCIKANDGSREYRICANENDIIKLDHRALEVIGAKENDIYTYKEIREMIKNAFNSEEIDYVCSGCKWSSLGYCKKGILKL